MQRSAMTALSLGLCAVLAIATIAVESSNAQPGERPQPDMGAALAQGLNETEGCLKVTFAQTSDGHNTIMAWFEDKAAAERWYSSETHARFMRMTGSDPNDGEPMAHVPDGVPIFVMASIKMSKDGTSVLPGPMPIEQISIELYTPLDAGAAVNGRLMPDGIELEHFKNMESAMPNE